ncbi:MAG: hypothetical protein ACRDZ4_03890 [Egibacteraceae bacterium]
MRLLVTARTGTLLPAAVSTDQIRMLGRASNADPRSTWRPAFLREYRTADRRLRVRPAVRMESHYVELRGFEPLTF